MRSPFAVCAVAALWGSPAAAAPTPYATPVDIAPPATTALLQYGPDVGMAKDGHAFVVYVEDDGKNVQRLWLQRVGPGAVKEGARIPAGPDGPRNDFPAIAMAPDGRFVVAYRAYTSGSTAHVEVQRFAANGTPVGAAIPVDGANNDNDADKPGLGIASDGRFAVAWVRNGPEGMFVRAYTKDGAPLTAPQPFGDAGDSAARPSIAMRADGRFWLTWFDSTTFGDPARVPLRRFKADGTPDGGQTTLYEGAVNANLPNPTLGVTPTGGGFLAFQAFNGSAQETFGRLVNPAGTGVGGTFSLADPQGYDRINPDVFVDPDGDVLVVVEGQVGTQRHGFIRHFAPDGTPQGPPQKIDQSPSDERHLPRVAGDGSTRSAVVWQRGGNVWVQRWDYNAAPGPPPPPPPPPSPPAQDDPSAPADTAPTTTTTTDSAAATPPALPATPVAALSLAAAPKIADVVRFPSTRRCASRRNFKIRLRIPRDATVVTAAVVKVNGKQVAVRRGVRLRATVDLRSLPKGRFSVTIELRLSDGRIVKGTRKYRTCTPKRRGHRAPKV